MREKILSKFFLENKSEKFIRIFLFVNFFFQEKDKSKKSYTKNYPMNIHKQKSSKI